MHVFILVIMFNLMGNALPIYTGMAFKTQAACEAKAKEYKGKDKAVCDKVDVK